MIHDVKEKEVGAVKAPTFPQPKSATTGFPEHKKRTRVSAFKQKRESQSSPSDAPTVLIDRPQPPGPSSRDVLSVKPEEDERQRIDRENRQVLSAMSAEQIAEARKEVFEGLDPSLLQMLLKRANLDDSNGSSPFDLPTSNSSAPRAKDEAPDIKIETPKEIPKDMGEEEGAEPIPQVKTEQKPKTSKKVTFDEDAAPPTPPSNLFSPAEPIPETDAAATTNTTHFPQPRQLPDLDPSDPDFLAALHEKFFPSLPADPSRLAWMAPVPTPHSAADRESPYYPGQASLPVSALRFDFRGRLLSPRASRAVPASRGLHHHGEAPEAAGYTVPELGRLARSAVPAQRCVAFQALGRVLYRLGRGEWGAAGDDAGLAAGIWRTAQENRVVDSLLEAAEVPEGAGHRGSRAYAIEALWLFEKGGWREMWKGR